MYISLTKQSMFGVHDVLYIVQHNNHIVALKHIWTLNLEHFRSKLHFEIIRKWYTKI